MWRTNNACHIEWYETCACKCRLDASVCNNKQHWGSDKCWCECKELIDKSKREYGSIWNPSICECDHWIIWLIDQLVKKCDEDIGNKMVYNATLNDYWRKRKSCMLYIKLLIITFKLVKGVSGELFYFYWHTIKILFTKWSHYLGKRGLCFFKIVINDRIW